MSLTRITTVLEGLSVRLPGSAADANDEGRLSVAIIGGVSAV